MNLQRSVSAWVWGTFAILYVVSLGLAQEPAVSEPSTEPPALQLPDEPGAAEAQPDPAAEPRPETPLREQTIYIPYTKLREVFEKEGRGVFIPYDKFQELWKAAREKASAPDLMRPPVDALIAEIESEATVQNDVVHVDARLKIEILVEGWAEIPLRLTDAAVLSARLGQDPARLAFSPDRGYSLLIENPNKDPRHVELSLEYAKAFTRSPGRNSISFQAPQSPVNRWKIRVPETGVKVDIQPLIAATELPAEVQAASPDAVPGNDPLAVPNEAGAGLPGEANPAVEPGDNDAADPAVESAPQEKPPAETVIIAFVGATADVRFDWTPKAEGATGLAALTSVQAQQQVYVEEGALRTRARLEYDISRADLSRLVIEVPADQKVVNVFDPNVRQWQVEGANAEGAAPDANSATQRITVDLFQPVRGMQVIEVELEKFFDDPQSQGLVVPVVQAIGAGRQQGLTVVRLSEGLRGEAARDSGLLRVDANELPPALAGTPWAFSYRYAVLPFDLALNVEKVQPRVTVDELVEVYLEPQQVTMDLLALYEIEKAGIFQLDLEIPSGYEIRQVRGFPSALGEPVTVDGYHLEGEPATHLVVSLGHKAIGKVALLVELQKNLDDPNLLTPTGKTSELPLAPIRASSGSVERSTGRMIVYAPEGLRVNSSQLSGLRNVSLDEALQSHASTRENRFPDLRPVLTLAYAQEPASLTVTAERRRPQVNVAQLLVASVDAGVARYQATLHYDIRYSGVKTLRVDVPAELATEIHNETTAVHESRIEPAPDDVAAGYVAWSLTGESEFLGRVTVDLSWERPIEALEIGKSVDLALPRLLPRNVDRAWGQVVLVKAESIDLIAKGDAKGLRPIDPQHDLMPEASVPDAARAFEFHDEWSLSVSATRYKLEEVKRTSVERSLVRLVVTRGGQVATQALYRMRSAAQRLAVKLPPGAEFDVRPVRINGQYVSPQKGAKDEFFVPLTGQDTGEPFLLEVRYALKGGASKLEFPEFPAEHAAQKVYLCVYLPQELALLGSRGPWTDELSWRCEFPLNFVPSSNRSDSDLFHWVIEGTPGAESQSDSFQTDGQLYLYSSSQPDALPGGSLRLVSMNSRALRALVVAMICVCGIVMIRRPLGQRCFVLGSVLVGLVLAGVFVPTFTMQVLDGTLLAALGIVVVAWMVWYVAKTRPRRLAAMAAYAATLPGLLLAQARSAPAANVTNASTGEAQASSEAKPETAPSAENPPGPGTPPDQGQAEGGSSHA